MRKHLQLGPRIRSETLRGRRVLVTGIGGFVGSALARELLARGAKVIGILRDSAGSIQLEAVGIRHSVDLVFGSIGDAGLVSRVLAEYEVDTIFHLAAQAMVQVANRSPISTFESNIAGTWTVLEAARLSPVIERVVVASSDKAYGDQPALPYTESTPLHAQYPYDVSKACADLLARCYATSFLLPVAVVRCANIYGPGDLNWSRLVPGTIRAALAAEDPVIRSDGSPERDYIYLNDAVEAYLMVAEHLPEVAGQAFNFGTGRPVSVLDLVNMILTAVGDAGLRPRVLGEAAGEISRQSLSHATARQALGWEPQTSLLDGLNRSVDWYRDHLASGRVIPLAAFPP